MQTLPGQCHSCCDRCAFINKLPDTLWVSIQKLAGSKGWTGVESLNGRWQLTKYPDPDVPGRIWWQNTSIGQISLEGGVTGITMGVYLRVDTTAGFDCSGIVVIDQYHGDPGGGAPPYWSDPEPFAAYAFTVPVGDPGYLPSPNIDVVCNNLALPGYVSTGTGTSQLSLV